MWPTIFRLQVCNGIAQVLSTNLNKSYQSPPCVLLGILNPTVPFIAPFIAPFYCRFEGLQLLPFEFERRVYAFLEVVFQLSVLLLFSCSVHVGRSVRLSVSTGRNWRFQCMRWSVKCCMYRECSCFLIRDAIFPSPPFFLSFTNALWCLAEGESQNGRNEAINKEKEKEQEALFLYRQGVREEKRGNMYSGKFEKNRDGRVTRCSRVS